MLFCVIFRALHLAQPGLTAGRLAGRLAGRQNPRDFKKFLKFIIDRNNRLLALFNKRKALLQLYQLVFRLKLIGLVFRCAKMLHSIHSLSIPTIVLNDTGL